MSIGKDICRECGNEWVNACSKEDKTQKDRQRGREERMKINGRQELGVMHKTCKMFRYCVVGREQ